MKPPAWSSAALVNEQRAAVDRWSRRLIVSPSTGLAIFGAMMLLIAASLAWHWQHGAVIETNVLALLPPAERDPVVAGAVAEYDTQLVRRHIVLVGGQDFAGARQAAEQLAGTLAQGGQFAEVLLRIDDSEQQAAARLYHRQRGSLLSPALREKIEREGPAAAIQQARQTLYSPAAAINSSLLAQDPLLLFYDFIAAQGMGRGSLQLRDGLLTTRHDDRDWIMLQLRLAGDPFAMDLQQAVVPALDEAVAALRGQHPGIEVVDIGAVRYAKAGVDNALQEVSTIGVLSVAGVVLLTLVVFRSPLPLVATLAPVVVGAGAALAACWHLFGSIHMLTLVFGTSLLGIAVDYCMHFFSDRLAFGPVWTATNGLDRIIPGITIGLVTTVVGYAGLFASGFPAMQQMAVFSSVGVTAATCCVIWLYPAWVRRPTRRDPTFWLRLSARTLHQLRPRHWRQPALVLLPLLALAAVGLARLESNDDIRLLQSVPAELRSAEQRLRAITGVTPGSQFLLLRAESEQQLLEREESLAPALQQLMSDGAITGFEAISQRLPSLAAQRANREQLRRVAADHAGLAEYADELGLEPALIDAWREQIEAGGEGGLTPADWLASAAGRAQDHLWLGPLARFAEGESGYASLMPLQGVRDGAALASLADDHPWLHYVDKVADLSDLFGRYRERTVWLIAIGYGAILLLLIGRYGWVRGTAVMLPTALAALLTIAGLGWIGEQLNLFHLLALLLVLGIGIDYALFLVEGFDHADATMLTILLSALSTELSFGLLAVSDTPAVRAFGLTVFIGVAGSVLLAPLVMGWGGSKRHADAAAPAADR